MQNHLNLFMWASIVSLGIVSEAPSDMVSIVIEFELNGVIFVAKEEVVANVTLRPLEASCLENWIMGLM